MPTSSWGAGRVVRDAVLGNAVKPVLEGNLTKKFLMQLEVGLYLMSNIGDKYRCPIYEGAIVAPNLRDMQWEKIKQVGAANRLCRVFKTKSEYVRWVDSVK